MRLAPLAALACVAFLALAGSASAQIFNVTTTADNSDPCTPTACSIRAALAAADAGSGEDTVNIPAGHYVLTLGELETNAIDDTLNIVGHSARDTIIDANGQSRVYFVDDGIVNLSHVTITGGVAAGDLQQDPGQGGGIFFNGQQMNIDHVAVVGNQAASPPDFGGQGGGIFANEPTAITNSLVSGNVADGTDSDFSGGQGGGIFGNEALTLTNVTVSNNTAKPSLIKAAFPHSQGGGVFVNEQDTTLTNVTMTGNTASGDDAGGAIFINDDMKFQNTLIARNTVDGVENNCLNNENTLAGDHNLEGGTDCGFTAAGDIQNADPGTAALGNNGGETDTQALLTGSAAIDHADGATCPATDQRDLPRPQFAGCDIGAFEVQPAAATPPPPPAAKDTTRPRVTVAGVRAACVAKGTVSIRVRATDASGVKATRVTLDGKRIHTKNKTRFTLKINVKKLSAGRHVLRIVTTDAAGNRTSARRTITRCAKPKPRRVAAPRFTG
jgi:hypothetical protein